MFEPSSVWQPSPIKEPCREIIAFAKAEWQDVIETKRHDGLCPVLTALRKAHPKKSEAQQPSLLV